MRSTIIFFLALTSLLQVIGVRPSVAQIHAWRRSLSAQTNTIGINPLNQNSVYAQLPSGLIGVSFDKGKSWTPLGSPGLSQVRQIVVHPSDTTVVLAAAFGGGLRRSTDYGASWSIVIPSYGIDGESITYDLNRPDTMFAGNFPNGAVFRSTDRGATWTEMGAAGSVMCALAHRPDSANILYAGTGGGRISKSTDFGATWRLVATANTYEIPKIVIDPINPLIAYGAAYAGADSNDGVWKTTNGGELWERTSLAGVSIWALDISHIDPNVLYAGSFSDMREAVFRTTDAGITWDTLKTGFPRNGNAWGLKVDPFDPQTVWLAINGSFTQAGIYRWAQLRARVQGIVRDSATAQPVTTGFIVLGSTQDTVRLEPTGMYSFDYFDGDSTLNPVAHAQAYPFYLHDEQLSFILDSIASHDVFLQRLPKATISGIIRSVSTQQPVQAVVELFGVGSGTPAVNTNTSGMFQLPDQYISYPPIVVYDSLYVISDFPFAQKIFRPIEFDTLGLFYDLQVDTADVLIVSTHQNEGFLGHNRFQGFYREALDSLGLTSHVWYRIGRGYAPARRARELRKKTAIYYSGSETTSLLSYDRDSLIAGINAGVNLFITGQNFVEANDSLSQNYFGIRHGGNTNQLFLRGTAGDLFGEVVAGTIGGSGANNQTSRDTLLVDNPRAHIPLTYGAGGGAGTAAIRLDSIGSGGKLVLFGFGFEALNTASVRKFFMQQIIDYFDGLIVLGVEHSEENIPGVFSLEQNYPNPFNPSTSIRFRIPQTGHVTITVYNLLGQEVTALVNEEKVAGTYSVRWNASSLSSGVYLYRLQSGNYIETKKMILLR